MCICHSCSIVVIFLKFRNSFTRQRSLYLCRKNVSNALEGLALVQHYSFKADCLCSEIQVSTKNPHPIILHSSRVQKQLTSNIACFRDLLLLEQRGKELRIGLLTHREKNRHLEKPGLARRMKLYHKGIVCCACVCLRDYAGRFSRRK